MFGITNSVSKKIISMIHQSGDELCAHAHDINGGKHTSLHCTCTCTVASFPGLHAQLLSLAVQKAGGRPGRSRHVIRAAIDVTACLLELMTQGVRPPYVPISARPDDNGRRQSLEASHRSRIREQ